MPAMANPITPLEGSGEMFQRGKRQSLFDAKASSARPLSEATEIYDTDFENESEFEEDSPKGSFESFDSRRRSQTTVSSYDEAPTPSSNHSLPFEIRFKPVEGPRGPHLFSPSQPSNDSTFDYALQMSPLLPKLPPARTETAFSVETVTPITRQQPKQPDFSIATALAQPRDDEDDVRAWSSDTVIAWMFSQGIEGSIVEQFEAHDINGAVLLDLQFDDLKELDIQSFGKRHQLWYAISDLRGGAGRMSPVPTLFQDVSRPCTTTTRSLSRNGRTCTNTPIDDTMSPITPGVGNRKRRGRKQPRHLDVITPAESVSIVAIEQLLPKPHTCAKGERCAKWRKQQREIQQLHDDHGIGQFPVSPTKGGHIFIAGNPGNAHLAENMIPNVRLAPPQPESPYRPASGVGPSIVASSDLLGPSQLPEFMLHPHALQQLETRDAQDNVRQFLNFQHLHTPSPPLEDNTPASMPPLEMFPSQHVPIFSTHQPSLHPPSQTPGPHANLTSLPRLAIPRSASAAPHPNHLRSADAMALDSCRSATASPGDLFRHGTPASEMDVPLTAIPIGPVSRDASQSVPPNMHFREFQKPSLSRSNSKATDWRRPSFALPALNEGEVFSPSTLHSKSSSQSSTSSLGKNAAAKVADPAKHSPQTQTFTGYGTSCTHAGWMKRRKTKMLRHEWQDSHFRLKGTQLGMHANARLSTAASDTINVDDYAVACSSVASGNKLSAALKSMHLKQDRKDAANAAAFAFQLVPAADRDRRLQASRKTHHFAVKSRDERIDWMRELMLAKALQQKGKGYEVEVYGVQA